MTTKTMRSHTLLLAIVCLGAISTAMHGADRLNLDNGEISADFGSAGLVKVTMLKSKHSIVLANDSATLTVDGERLAAPGLKLVDTRRQKESIAYTYRAGNKQLQVIYELKPDWRFVSKQLVLTLPPGDAVRVDAAEVFRAEVKSPVAREHKASAGSGAVFLRLGEAASPAEHGAFLVMQNPFLKWERTQGQVAMCYVPDLQWRAAYGPFASDRVCIGLYVLSGFEFPSHNIGEWKFMRDPQRAFEGIPSLDRAEFDAVTNCVHAFALFRPTRSLRVHVPWCENDYQIDVATPAGRAEWKRILDQAAAVGCRHSLFTPANSEVAPLKDNADAWGWENCLWLGLGQKIRKGEWNIAKDPIPPSIQEMLDYAKSKNVELIAYAYPTLGWKQNAEWTAWCQGKTGGYVGVDTGVRSFQDWFVDQLVAFQKRTGVGGFSFDHWWIAYEPTKEGTRPTSKYAQWYGCRRILEELRRRIPDVVVDGRQQYQWFGAWTWLGGSYPHPTTNDEQPGSFQNFPDLHFSRVSGDRQRWASWYYHMEQFTPWELVPGYMTHQTPRNDARGQCVRDHEFQIRDWDYLGWRYSVLSSIATAPFNHVVNYLPARDEAEFKHFRPEDQRWLRHWLGWTDSHRTTLRNLRPIIGPPALGRVDGMAAFAGDRGFMFLFNPNYRELNAEFPLDASIGLSQGDTFLLREIYPREGRWRGRPRSGVWHRGDKVSLPIKGPEALVLELVPAAEVTRPVLLGANGDAAMEGNQLVLRNVQGESGQTLDLVALLPAGQKAVGARINGRPISALAQQGDAVPLQVTFAGARIDHCMQIGMCDRAFAEKTYRSEFTVPQRVFQQLAERRKIWPISYTDEELLATWRGSSRLLLYAHIADPKDTWTVGLKIDGQSVTMKRAYSDVFPLGRDRTFTGCYADISALGPDARHTVEVSLPDGLQPGQFQGLFLENVESEFVKDIDTIASKPPCVVGNHDPNSDGPARQTSIPR
jgi:hypothetical protein